MSTTNQVREAALPGSLPTNLRPRERMLRYGVGQLSDAELLALVIGVQSKTQSAVEIARDTLEATGGLNPLAALDRAHVTELPHLNEGAWIKLQSAMELARRILFESIQNTDVLSSPEAVRQYLRLQLSTSTHEVFSVLYLDSRHQVIKFEALFHGTINGAAVYPREVVKRCLALNATSVIFAHNHPSGVAEPSDVDIRLTRKLTDALALVDIRVLDHLIIGRGVQTSLAERGLM